jgi:hypothetical protein
MGLIGSDTRLLVVTWSKLPAERPVSRMSRPVVLLSLVRAPAQPPQHAYFGSRSHTPSNRCLRFERRVAATPARLAPVRLARLWTDQTCTGKLASASPIAPRIRLSDWLHLAAHGGALRSVRAAEAASDGKRAQQHRPASVFAAGSSFFRSVRMLLGVSGSPPITDPRLRPKRTRSKGPFLRQHYPASTVVWPSPTPVRPAACATLGLPAPVRTGLPR